MASSTIESLAASRTAQRTSGDRRGWVFDIKRFSVHDGPGIRTTIFLKGCSLRCVWCHNPESINARPQLVWYPMRCVGCGTCLNACPVGAHNTDPKTGHMIDRGLCQSCGRCTDSCYAEALVLAGQRVSVDEVMSLVLEDSAYYQSSGGGVTLSGGEPLFQGAFATKVLRRCKEEGLHTALDTSGHVSWRVLARVLPYVDLILYDLKCMSPQKHREFTGETNGRILQNLAHLDQKRIPLEIRMPIVPGCNDDAGEVESAAHFLAHLQHPPPVRLLAYHSLAGSKYSSLGLPNCMPRVDSPSHARLQQIAEELRGHGLTVMTPGD